MPSRAITGSSERWSRRCCCEVAVSLGAGPSTRSFSRTCLRDGTRAGGAGEVQVDVALRELLAAEAVITVESVGEVLAKLDTVPPVTMVEVAPVDLAIFDQLCTEMGVPQ